MKKIILIIFFFVFVSIFYTVAAKNITQAVSNIQLSEQRIHHLSSLPTLLSEQNYLRLYVSIACENAMEDIKKSAVFKKAKPSLFCLNAGSEKKQTVIGRTIIFRNDYSFLSLYCSSVPLYILFHSFLIPFQSYS